MSHNNYSEPWRAVLSTNTTDTGFDTTAATATTPANDSTLTVNGRSNLELILFGAGSDNNTMAVRVVGWARTAHTGAALWVRDVICEASATLSTDVGVSGYVPANTDRLADTITITDGTGHAPTGGNNVAIKLLVDVSNYVYVDVLTHNNSSATNTNALYRMT